MQADSRLTQLRKDDRSVGYPVSPFEVLAKDAPTMRRFNHGAFDSRIGPPDRGYPMVFPDSPGSINGGIGQAMDDSGHVTFYLEVPHLGEMLAKIGTLGGSTVMKELPAELCAAGTSYSTVRAIVVVAMALTEVPVTVTV